MAQPFDVAVIGGGAAGLFAAGVAASLQARTALIEKRALGGDCTWYGCMPSKTLLKSAFVAHWSAQRRRYGLPPVPDDAIPTETVLAHVRQVRDEVLRHEQPAAFEQRGIRVIIGPAKFVDHHTVEVAGRPLQAKKFILCTGSAPLIPPVTGLKDIPYLTNETFFEQHRLPASLIVLGAGPIGVEMAQAARRLGSSVVMVELSDRVLFREDPDMSQVLAAQLRKEGIELLTGHTALGFSQGRDGITVTVQGPDRTQAQRTAAGVLVAAGRRPNVHFMDLEKAGVAFTAQGITVNKFLQTTNPRIFACGDVVGPYQFSHVAAYQAGVAVRNALFRRPAWSRVQYDSVGWCTFTDPEVARVGMTEAQARENYAAVKVYTAPYSSCDRAMTDRVRDGLVKIITDKKDRLLGAHICGSQAGEIIQGLLIAKSLRIPVTKLATIPYIYPTLSEVVKKTAAQPLVESLRNPLVKLLMKVLRKN